jgi:hypothetical protein
LSKNLTYIQVESDRWIELLGRLELAAGSTDDPEAATGSAVVDVRSPRFDHHRVHGGQLLGQLIEATRKMLRDRAVKSPHTVFARMRLCADPVEGNALTERKPPPPCRHFPGSRRTLTSWREDGSTKRRV